jgi:hypothetical protein
MRPRQPLRMHRSYEWVGTTGSELLDFRCASGAEIRHWCRHHYRKFIAFDRFMISSCKRGPLFRTLGRVSPPRFRKSTLRLQELPLRSPNSRSSVALHWLIFPTRVAGWCASDVQEVPSVPGLSGRPELIQKLASRKTGLIPHSTAPHFLQADFGTMSPESAAGVTSR